VSIRSILDGRPEIRDALALDLEGRVLEAAPGAQRASEDAASAASAVALLRAAGSTAGLTSLALLVVKAARFSRVTAVRSDALLTATVDGAGATGPVVKSLQEWAPAARPATRPPPLAAPAAGRPARPTPRPTSTTPLPGAPPAPAAPAPVAPADPWAALRRALVRGQLTEAAARQREIAAAPARGEPRAGAEALPRAELQACLQGLVEGIGSVMAGDGIGGGRALAPLAAPAQPNLSVRWLALLWSARAALRSGGIAAAGGHVKEALALARQLDVESRAATQLVAAEVLAHDRDPTKALAWLREARGRLERLGDRWGLAQTWLLEARILGAAGRDDEAAAAAGHASKADPSSDEPAILLARRALAASDLARADELLRPVQTPAAERVRSLLAAIRGGSVSAADAGELLRLHDGPPTPEALRALERIAAASPRLVLAREALARMLLKVGRYAEARTLFRDLLALPLGPADRASVMLGLGCIANALQDGGGREPVAALRQAERAGAAAAAQGPAASSAALPRLSSSLLMGAGGAGPAAVFSGQLADFALPDLLEFLRSARRTGLLVLSTRLGMGAVRFRDGLITGAAAPATPGIGEALVRLRKLTPLALAAARAPGSDEPDDAVGDALVEQGLVDAAAVQEAQRHRIELAVRELVGWKDGEFAFSRDGDGAPARAGGTIAVDPQAVLLEVFRQLDEESRDPPRAGGPAAGAAP
jgi:tetratricopeptide (TPR) repeat protein